MKERERDYLDSAEGRQSGIQRLVCFTALHLEDENVSYMEHALKRTTLWTVTDLDYKNL